MQQAQAVSSATLMKQGDYDALKDKLEGELRCNLDPGAMSSYALCEAAIEKDFDSARKLCYQALKRDRENPEIYNNLGKIFLLSGERASAFKILSKGLTGNSRRHRDTQDNIDTRNKESHPR